MKVQTFTPLPDFASESGRPARGGADYGDEFDRAVRAASVEPAAKRAPREADAGGGGERPATSAQHRAPSEPARRVDDAAKAEGSAASEDGGRSDPKTTDDEAAAARVDPRDLGQVISSLATARDGGALGPDPENGQPNGQAKTSAGGEAVEAGEKNAEPTGARGAGAVRLEVLGMETHFEPTVCDVVLVEGKADTGAPEPQGGDEPTIKLSFDEMLQRLNTGAPLADAGNAQPTTRSGKALQEDLRPIAASARALLRDGQDVSGREAGAQSADDVAAALDEASQARGKTAEPPLPRVAATRREEGEGTGRRFAALEVAAAVGGEDAGAGRLGSTAAGGTGAPLAGIASLTSQVAGRVIDSFGGAGGFGQRQADLPSGQTHLRMQAGGAALKTLTIQLQPENLGRLDVSMRLIDGKLTLEVAATERHTAQVLASDREGLRKLLEHAGFSLDDGSIVIQTRDAASIGAKPAADAQGQQDGSAAGQNRNGQASGGSEGQSPERRARNGEEEALRQGAGRPGSVGIEPASGRSGTTYL